MRIGRLAIYCVVIFVVIATLALAFYAFFLNDSLIIHNGTSQAVVIKSVKINGHEVDSYRTPLPITLPPNTDIEGSYKDALWFSFQTLSSEVNLVVELVNPTSGSIDVQRCVNKRTAALRSCSFEGYVTKQGLQCGLCETDL